jgi:hypothetical protein
VFKEGLEIQKIAPGSIALVPAYSSVVR